MGEWGGVTRRQGGLGAFEELWQAPCGRKGLRAAAVPLCVRARQDWDISLDDMGAEGAKEQWGVENLSHHFLPLIRYRREKARRQVRPAMRGCRGCGCCCPDTPGSSTTR